VTRGMLAVGRVGGSRRSHRRPGSGARLRFDSLFNCIHSVRAGRCWIDGRRRHRSGRGLAQDPHGSPPAQSLRSDNERVGDRPDGRGRMHQQRDRERSSRRITVCSRPSGPLAEPRRG
jgi:hypothetical protein